MAEQTKTAGQSPEHIQVVGSAPQHIVIADAIESVWSRGNAPHQLQDKASLSTEKPQSLDLEGRAARLADEDLNRSHKQV